MLRAALGRVPGQTHVPRTASAQRSVRSSQSIIIMGSYLPSDYEGLRQRERLARQTGYPIRVTPSTDLGVDGPYTIIYAGPYDSYRAEGVLNDVKRTVPDAFRKTMD